MRFALLGCLLLALAPPARAEAAWEQVGRPDATFALTNPAFADVGGRPVAAWWEGATGNTGQLRVQSFRAGAWEDVGGPVSVVEGSTEEPSLVALDGLPIVTYTAPVDGVRKLFVARSSDSQWTIVGGGPLNEDADADAGGASLEVIGGSIHVAWSESTDTTRQIHVKKFTAGAWADVGSSVNAGISVLGAVTNLESVGGAPHVSWISWDQVGATTRDVRVSRFDGTSWLAVGGQPAGQVCSGLFPACESAVPACPVGARCGFEARADGADKDLSVSLLTNAYVVERVTPEIRARHGFSAYLPGTIVFGACWNSDPTQDKFGTCPDSASSATIGDGSAPSFLCPIRAIVHFQSGTPPALGPAADRYSRCDFKMTIEAAPTLVVLPADNEIITAYAPGPGSLTAASPGAIKRTATIARTKNGKPLFRTTTKRVKRAGPVRFELALSRPAKKTFRKKKRLALRVELTFKPRQGKTIDRTAKVTLRKPVRPGALPRQPQRSPEQPRDTAFHPLGG